MSEEYNFGGDEDQVGGAEDDGPIDDGEMDEEDVGEDDGEGEVEVGDIVEEIGEGEGEGETEEGEAETEEGHENEEEESEDELDLGEEFGTNDVIEFQKMLNHHRKLCDQQTSVPNRITKYEMCAIIGFRAQQIAEGATPYVKANEGDDAITIAIEEFKHNLIPLEISRPYPSNKFGSFKYHAYKLGELINTNPIV